MAASFKDIRPVNENLINIEATRAILAQRIQETNEEDQHSESSVSNQSDKFYNVGFYDIDEALGYYFRDVLKPTVIENGETKSVPVLYGSPERWKSLDSDGLFRDEKSKLILPLIMYRRTSMSKNTSMIFPRVPEDLYLISKQRFDIRNKYDSFNILNPRRPDDTDKYSLTTIPNFLIITYEGLIWTSYLEQINKLIEKIIYNEGTYWGDPNKFKFRTEIESIDNDMEVASDRERSVRARFNMTIYGQVLPEEFGYKKTSKIGISPKKVIFNQEVVTDINNIIRG
jgi:hypothetical protein